MAELEKQDGQKFVLASKTVMSNALYGNAVVPIAIELIPQLSLWIQSHPQTAVMLASMLPTWLNIVLRHFTEGGISYAPKKKDAQ